MEVEGANNRLQLAALERYFQNKQASKLLLEGVMIYDPARFDLRGTLEHGKMWKSMLMLLSKVMLNSVIA